MTELADKTGALDLADQPNQHLAWSQEDSLSTAGQAFNRNMFGIKSAEFPALDLDEVDAIRQAIEEAPSLDVAVSIIFDHPHVSVSQTLTFLEQIKTLYSGSEAATEKIDSIVSHTTDIAKHAIAGEIETISPDDAVKGLIKALNVTDNPEIKEQVIHAIDEGIHDAEIHAKTDKNVYQLDPIVAVSAREVIDDIRHASSPESIDSEGIFERRSRIHEIEAERAAVLADAQVRLQEYDELLRSEHKALESVTPKKGLRSAVRNILRFGR